MLKNKKINVKNMILAIFFNGLVLYAVVILISTPFIYYDLSVEEIDISFLEIFKENIKDCLKFFIIGGGVGLFSYIFEYLKEN
jgi:hypothetical protein